MFKLILSIMYIHVFLFVNNVCYVFMAGNDVQWCLNFPSWLFYFLLMFPCFFMICARIFGSKQISQHQLLVFSCFYSTCWHLNLLLTEELKTLSEQDHVWLVFNTAETVKLTYENAASADEAARYVAEDSAEAFAAMRQWELEAGRRQWAGHFRQLRMQSLGRLRKTGKPL